MKLKDMWATLRTFSLDDCSFPTMIENVALLLRTMTIDIYKNSNKSISWVFYVITIVAACCYFYVYIFSMLWLVFSRYSVTENYIEMTIAISLTTASVTSVTKLLFMMLYVKNIRETIEKILSFDALIVQGTRFSINLRENLRAVKKRALVIWTFLVADGALFAMSPFLRPGRHFTEDLYIIYGLEPMVESPNYEIAHVVTNISIIFCVYVMVNVAVYVIVVVGYVEAQMYSISVEVTNIWEDSQHIYNNMKQNIHNKVFALFIKEKIKNEYTRIRLKTIVHYHVTNINIFQDLKNQFREILVLEYSIIIIAIITLLLGGLENTYIQMPFIIVLISIDCLSGQKLIDACHEFEKALYSCEWENFNASNQKTILLMLAISQKTFMLSAGGMANLNFECLMIIFKSSYSAYTTLKSSIQH